MWLVNLLESMNDYQKILFPYAYNILGSVEDSKDVIQDVMSAHYGSGRQDITDLKNYLIKSVINRSITFKEKRQKQTGQTPVWLPEPVATEDAADRNTYLNDILSYSLLVLLERLSPTERAVFLLKESLDYTHQEIGEVLNITQENSRKLLSRAKQHLFKPGKPGASVGPGSDPSARGLTTPLDASAPHILERYMEAIRKRDTHRLESMLYEEIAVYADGGGKVPLAATSCFGASAVAALLVDVYHRFQATDTVTMAWMNYQPAFLYHRSGKLVAIQVFELSPEGKILQINNVLDPDKLRSTTTFE
jgi:RNA polymerase sigma-70 factor (ECF subfamily)